MACCTVAAFFIYRLIKIHETISGLHLRQSAAPNIKDGTPVLDTEHGLQSCRLSLTGLTCTACSESIRKALLLQPGVNNVHVSHVLCQAYVAFEVDRVDIASIISIIEEHGYGAELELETSSWHSRFYKADEQRRAQIKSWTRASATSAILTLSILLLPHAPISEIRFCGHISLLQAFLSAIVLFICAYPIHRDAIRSIFRMKPNMALLSSLGLLSGFAQALLVDWKTLTGQGVFGFNSFDALAALCTVVLGGRLIKALTIQNSFSLTTQLAASVPLTATITFVRDEERDPFADSALVPVDMLRVGDWVIVLPQTAIPGDGVVVRGTSHVLEAVRTGELYGKQKKVGDQAFAGTANNEKLLVIELTRHANDTWLDATLRHVAQAEGVRSTSQTSLALLTDRFVTGVICLTIVSILVWRIAMKASWSLCLERAASMLLCACPCALGLANPTCITLAIATASRSGVLLKGGDQQIEAATKIKALLFDKTGTLTMGNLQLHEIIMDATWKASLSQMVNIWAAIGKIEEHSQHPVGKLLAWTSKKKLSEISSAYHEIVNATKVADIRNFEGMGVRATAHTLFGSLDIAIGSLTLMESLAVDAGSIVKFKTDLNPVQNAVYVCVNGQATMSLTYSDALRSDATATVEALRSQGIEVGLITGGTTASAKHIAKAVGISPEWTFANRLPMEKVHVLKQIHERFGPVAMVGDNFNDIPALACSSFSFSLSNYSDMLSTTGADAHLPRSVTPSLDLLRIPYILNLARLTHSTLQTNIYWAISYNILALILASASLKMLHPSLTITPSLASLGMCMSSTFVFMRSMVISQQSPRSSDIGPESVC